MWMVKRPISVQKARRHESVPIHHPIKPPIAKQSNFTCLTMEFPVQLILPGSFPCKKEHSRVDAAAWNLAQKSSMRGVYQNSGGAEYIKIIQWQKQLERAIGDCWPSPRLVLCVCVWSRGVFLCWYYRKLSWRLRLTAKGWWLGPVLVVSHQLLNLSACEYSHEFNKEQEKWRRITSGPIWRRVHKVIWFTLMWVS